MSHSCRRRALLLGAASWGIAGCSNPDKKPRAELTQANSYAEFTRKIASDASSYAPYDHDFNEFPLGTHITSNGTIRPLSHADWTFYPRASYPDRPNGRVQLRGSDPPTSRRSVWTDIDLTNNVAVEGESQAFYGVRSVDTATGNAGSDGRQPTKASVVVLVEGIATLGGAPYYRTIKRFTGTLYNTNDAGTVAEARQLLFYCRYEQFITEGFRSEVQLGKAFEYEGVAQIRAI